MEGQQKLDYLTLPTNELLKKFGEGNHVPGSGSAAAFSGLLGIELMKTVCKLTISREEDKYTKIKGEMEVILLHLEDTTNTLIELFQNDAECFDKVSKLRKRRDEKKKIGEKRAVVTIAKEENKLMKEATEIPLKIARSCISVVDYGFALFDKGFQSARGDTGVGISNLLSAISGSLFVTLLNIKTRRESKWTGKLREEAEKIGQEYNVKQRLALEKVLHLYKEGIVNENYQLKLNFD